MASSESKATSKAIPVACGGAVSLYPCDCIVYSPVTQLSGGGKTAGLSSNPPLHSPLFRSIMRTYQSQYKGDRFSLLFIVNIPQSSIVVI